MLTHVRIENHALLVNGYRIGKYPEVKQLAPHLASVLPEDHEMIEALLQVACSYDTFDYDLFIESDLSGQRAIQALLEASRSIS